MALQMSLDEISMAKSKKLSKSEEYSEAILPLANVQNHTEVDIPIILPK